MKDKYKPIIAGMLFGALLLIPLFMSSIASPVTVTTRNGIGGGSIEAAGNSSITYHGLITTTGGITVSCNNTYVDRLSRSVGFTVNASTMLQSGGWDTIVWGTQIEKCELNITFPNGTSSFRLSKTQTTSIFAITWKTNTTIPEGMYKIQANIWNISHAYTGGFNYTPSTMTTVEVYNILPVGSIATNATKLYRDQTLLFFISIFDPETPFTSLRWNVSLYKLNNPTPLKRWFPYDTLNQTYTFSGASDAGEYSFFVQIRDGSNGLFNYTVTPFTVLNNPPVISSVYYNYTANLKRVTQSMRFDVRVTDPDNVANASQVFVILEHQPDSLFPEKINFTSPALVYKAATGNFTGNITIPAPFPSGNAKITIEAWDNDTTPAVSRFHPQQHNMTIITNNIPVLNGVLINGRSPSAGLRFALYNNLDFAVNVSDIEDKIDYVRISLVGSDGTNITYYMLKPPYEVRISASALSPGSWGIFIVVADAEGGILRADSAGVIEVDPDLRDLTAYIIGGVLLVIAGFVIGGMVIWRYANARISAMRRDMIIKAKSKDAQEPAKKAKPGEKGASSKYVEPPDKDEPEPKPAAKTAEKPAAGKPFVGTQPPSAKGKPFVPEKKQDGSKPKSK